MYTETYYPEHVKYVTDLAANDNTQMKFVTK